MKAAVYHRFGGPEVVRVEDVPRPTPKATELLIRVHASTVSAADHRSRSKDVPAGLAIPSSLVLGFFRPRRPILGMDIAGVVEEVGADVTDLRVGDAVVAMLGSRFGGHAEYAIARQTDAIAHKPADLDFAEAVATVFGGITARAFFNQAALEPTSRVLVNGASGAVGSAAVQLAKAAGAHVTAVCSSDNTRMVSALGADRVIDYRVHDFAGEDSRYDIVMDCVGNAPASRVHPIIERGGALLHVAGDLRSMVGASRNRRKHNLRIVTEPGTYRSADLDYILELAETGGFRPVVDRTYTLDQITSAHRFVDSGRKRGNVVLTIAG